MAHKLGDWKSAFMLSVVYSSQVEGQLKAEDSRYDWMDGWIDRSKDRWMVG